MYHPTLSEVKSLSKSGNFVPIYREVQADLETPVTAFLKIHRGGPAFLLESVEGGERLARFSFIGTAPRKVISILSNNPVDPLTQIASVLGKYKYVTIPGLPRFSGGAVGYLAYETATRFEQLPSPALDPLNLPEACFMLADTMLIFDHIMHKIKVLSHIYLGDADVEQAYQQATFRIDELVDRLSGGLPLEPESQKRSPTARPPQSNCTRIDFEKRVEKIKEYIAEGEAIQVVLSQRLSQATCSTPLAVYRALRSINPSPYMFFLDFQDFQIIGASPEILVRVESGQVMTRPLAGTRPRGSTPAEDMRLESELRLDEKERAEHIMLVDLGRNDIGRVSLPGTITISDLMAVEKYSHVMHMVTQVQGQLNPELSCFDALRACFPAGTVSGAPKVRAMQIIREFETEKRGPYAGAAGYFGFSGNMDMAIAIRTMVMSHGTAHIQAGCGIVYDSIPGREYEETLQKAQALLSAICQAEGQGG